MQKSTTIPYIILVSALIVTGGYAYYLRIQLDQANAEITAFHEHADSGTVMMPRDGEVTALRKQLAQEQKRYATSNHDHPAKSNRPVTTEPAVTDTARLPVSSSDAFPSPGDFRGRMNAWMDRLKQEDPERYKGIIKAREDRQMAADLAIQDQVTTLAQRAQTTTNPTEADLVTKIATTLDQISQLRQARETVANLPEEQQQVKMQDIRDQTQAAYQTLDNLRQQDRTLQTQNLATQLGLQGANVQTLVDGVNAIQKNTQYSTGGRGGFNGTAGSSGGP